MSARAKAQALEALIEAHAVELKLPTVRRRFRALAEEATREQQTPVAYLAALLEAETQERAERRERRRLVDARFPALKRLEDFRFEDNPSVPQTTLAALAEGSWIDDREQVVLLGDSGTGKSHLAIALAVAACHEGRRVRFTTLAALANELIEADSRRELQRAVGRWARFELLVLDELGYLALPPGAAELVFQAISERDERGSLIVTTNLPFGEWGKVFPDARLAKAVVDRVTHRAHIIETGSESWRFRHGLGRTGRRSRPIGRLMRTLRCQSNQRRWGHFRPPPWGHCSLPSSLPHEETHKATNAHRAHVRLDRRPKLSRSSLALNSRGVFRTPTG
ncbi:MAG TPA: IS21-like element helper ATPase IstB [Thermoleophilaceae bacterium]|nr:IS21-like element helper ATPase IstB [Thermoleophilaceae bacterium]